MSAISRQVRAIEPVTAANSPHVGPGWVQEVVLVAGATGGTGRATIRALMRNNEKSDRSRWIIRALARKPDALKADLDSDLGLNHDVEVIRGDLLSRETLESALAGVSYVIFCAGAFETSVASILLDDGAMLSCAFQAPPRRT